MADEQTTETRQIRCPADLADMIGVVARFKGLSTHEYLDEVLRGPVTRDYREAGKKMQAAAAN